jgi:lipid-A-disaccharide synthase
MIISGESSGELYGSLLSISLKNRYKDCRIFGIGGKRMQDAGVEIISKISEALGAVEVLSSLNKIKESFDKAVKFLKEHKPDLLIVIDYPDFNIRLAGIAKSLGIKVLYYVSPQIWAWRKKRIKKIAEVVDKIAVILPFEEEIYRKAGIDCVFVGHPIIEEIKEVINSLLKNHKLRQLSDLRLDEYHKKIFRQNIGFEADRMLLSFLPGSRHKELERHLPLIIDVIKDIKKDEDFIKSRLQLCIPLAPNIEDEKFKSYFEVLKSEGVVIKKGESVRVLCASDFAVVASGTATLQAAFLNVPMVVIYKLSPLTYYLGRLIIDTKYICLINILAKKEVVKELIQKDANSKNIMIELKKIILDEDYRRNIISEYEVIKRPFLDRNASEAVVDIIDGMISG